jgi:6-pyruvoyl-tetrahydropterin synthase
VDLKRHLRDWPMNWTTRTSTTWPQFQGVETSAENQARYFFEELKKRLPERQAEGLLYARVWETPQQWAQYGPSPVTVPAHRAPAIS